MSTGQHIKAIGKRDIFLYSVSAVLLLDTLAAGAAIGVQSIFWWLFLGTVFFIPYAMITAELACCYPDQGGIYSWVKRAFGETWASRITWAYWVNVAVWCPAIYILFAGVFRQVLWPEMTLAGQIGLGLALTWLTVWLNAVTLNIGKWVPNVGAVLKVIVFLAIIGGAINHYQLHGMANEISWQGITPSFSSGVQYIGVIIYGMVGFELIAASSGEIHNPRKNLAPGILSSGFFVVSLYTLATAAILTAIPAGEVNLVEGLVDTLSLFLGGSQTGDYVVFLLALAALFTFFSNGYTWVLGGNRAIAEAASDGDFPAILAIESKKNKTPVGAGLAFGVVSSVILILYGVLANTNEDLFWSLFAFSAVLFLFPYVLQMLAFIKLRKVDGHRPRQYKLAGPAWLVYGLAYSCMTILVLAILSFAYAPDDGFQWPVILGASALFIIGEILIKHSRRQTWRH